MRVPLCWLAGLMAVVGWQVVEASPWIDVDGIVARPRHGQLPFGTELRTFDCQVVVGEKAADANHEADHPLSGPLRAGKDGGPGGAAWNAWGPLRCNVALATKCTGTARFALSFGSFRTTREAVLTPARSAEVQFDVDPDTWRSQLIPARSGMWDTLTLVLDADMTCAVDEQPPEAFHVADAFVARFAGGE